MGLLQFRWLRRLFAGERATLHLSTHQVPYNGGEPYGFLRAVDADSSGRFDFGEMPPGEYALGVDLNPNEAGVAVVMVNNVIPVEL